MLGILFALGALVSWGIGDFLIQRGTRKFGDWITLCYIQIIGAVVLFPFVYRDIKPLFSSHKDLLLLFTISVVVLVAALLDFEALKVGKISVIESINALEVLVTVGLGTYILNERLDARHLFLIFILLLGTILVSRRSFHDLKHIGFERGVFIALLAMIGMGTVNFLFGVGARQTNPLLVNWFTSAFLAVTTFIYLAIRSRGKELFYYLRGNKRFIIGVGIVDNAAWIFFAWSTLFIPIAIATAVSEAYIALAAILGLIFNKEKLKPHQFVGLILAVLGVVFLSAISGG